MRHCRSPFVKCWIWLGDHGLQQGQRAGASRRLDVVDLTFDADTPSRTPAADGAVRAGALHADAACAGAAAPAPHSPAAGLPVDLSPDASPAVPLLVRLQRRAPGAGASMQSAPVTARLQSGTAASAPAAGGAPAAFAAGSLVAKAGQAVAGADRAAGRASAGAPGPFASRAKQGLAGLKRSRPALQPLYASDDEQPGRQAPARPGAAGRSGAAASPSSAGALAAVAGQTNLCVRSSPFPASLRSKGCTSTRRCRQQSRYAGSA